MMNLQERIHALAQLGKYIQSNPDELKNAVHAAYVNNPWFTKAYSYRMLNGIATQYLQKDILENWASHYPQEKNEQKTIALILAGNIPCVGLHDLISVFISGHKALVKLSEKDEVLIKHLLSVLDLPSYFEIAERLQNFDAIIATGSNNSSRYFESYFGKYPNIIRKNRNGIGILDGMESPEELGKLGHDIFTYFGLGCRNVSKIYVPTEYKFDPLMEALHEFNELVLHNKYKNNFDYNYALFLLNQEEFLSNGCVCVRKDDSLLSRIACLHYEYYEDLGDLSQKLNDVEEQIQCVTGSERLIKNEKLIRAILPFGEAQNPGIMDYADGVDTMQFLCNV